LEEELDKLLSSSELELLGEELDKDNEDEDSFVNLEQVSAIDPSALLILFLVLTLKDHKFVCELVQSLSQTYQMASYHHLLSSFGF
jgi:hypothetical protein